MTPDELAAREASLDAREARLESRWAHFRVARAEVRGLKQEGDDIRELALCGLVGEILGHEIADSKQVIRRALETVPDPTLQAGALIEFNALVERVEGLGRATHQDVLRKRITGDLMSELISDASSRTLRSAISFSDEFRVMSVTCYTHRLVPALIAVIRNALIWVRRSDAPPEVRVDCVGGVISISDSGPGIPEEHLDSIWRPFFSMRMSRGIGLYLARANLESMGWTISARNGDPARNELPGARFEITPGSL